MRRAGIIALSILSAGMVQAATVTVKSGEHADFSRLVAYLPEGTDYDLQVDGRSLTLDLAGEDDHRFDVGTVFDLIPKTRVSGLSQPGGNRLTVTLNCDCQVTSAFEPPRLLIIDVADAVGTPVAAQMPAPSPAAPPAALRDRLRAPLVARQSYSTSGVSQFAEALAGRTTRQILDLGDPDAPRPASVAAPGPDLRDIDLPNIAVLGTAAGAPALTKPRRAVCAGLVAAPLGRFGGKVRFFREKAALSAVLFTEQLMLDPGVAVELAQLHLSQGLGSEAGQILGMIDRPEEGAGFLSQVARLIEAPDSLPRSTFEPYRDCSDVNAIWPLLAAARTPMGEADAWRIARAAESLPRPLLKVIGPRMIAHLIDAGRKDPANMIARILDRSGSAAGKTMADVLMAEGASEQEVILTEIAASNGEEAARASALLVDRQIEAGEPVPDGLAQLVASHAEEQRHGVAGSMLRKAEAFSLISKGDFAAALLILGTKALDAEAEASVTAQFFRELAGKADTVTFLRVVLAKPDLAATAPREVRQAVAARLYENRFPGPAARLILGGEPLDGALLAEALGARYHGDVGIPDAVLFAPSDAADRETAEARHAALLGAGRFAEAKQAALRLGREDPVDPLLVWQPEPEGTEALSGPELSLQRASALTEASASLAETVAEVLEDPLLRLEP
jgi:hypothetical protein